MRTRCHPDRCPARPDAMFDLIKQWIRPAKMPPPDLPIPKNTLATDAPISNQQFFAPDSQPGTLTVARPGAIDQQLSARDINNSFVGNISGDLHQHNHEQPPRSATFTLPAPKLFVGRAALLADLQARLQVSSLVNVTSLKGIGGVGKSALALEAGYRFAELFPHGRYWVDLRGGDATLAMRSFIRDLGLTNEEQLKGDLASLCNLTRNELQGRRVLLVLDNADRLPKDHVRQMCLPAPAATIITSRKLIGDDALKVDRLSEADALELMRQKGLRVDDELEDAKALVTRLGGLALALNITLSRMWHFKYTSRQALTQLEESGSVVQALKISLPDEQAESVIETFALTYERLDTELRAAFHATGICAPSGADLSAIASLLTHKQPHEARPLVEALHYISLVDFDGERFELHPLMHEYAHLCAQHDEGQYQPMYLRFVRYFGDDIGGAYQRATNDEADPTSAAQRIDAEIDNVELAQKRVLMDNFPDAELALQVTDNLVGYWRLRAYDLDQLLEWLQTAYQLAQKTNQVHRQANVLQAIGDVQSFRKEMDAALESYARALQLFTEVKDKLGQANVYLALGRLKNDAADFEWAIQLYEQIRDGYSIARGKYFYAASLLESGEMGQARQLLLEARTLWDAISFDGGVQAVDALLQEINP